ncbi:uncharacterized protein [Typha latifolia]|uniref:uncharacterized protein isoform X2 n=1 Tax=Typha latifolia TaxID=4733 RepID=UPI003C2C4177
MTQPQVDDAKFFSASVSPSSSHPAFSQSPSYARLRSRNVFQLLIGREISPRAKRSTKRLWHGTSEYEADLIELRCEVADAKHALFSWVESESLRHLSAKYCPLLPPPRSTIAAAFSSDGKTLASTHGDHTVKIIDCQTGNCLKVLSGHRRTPWVVRFHPLYSEILASGSLDHEVRLWDAHTADCIGSRDFYRPIASIAFHAQGELLAVASGHKLYIWKYNRRGEASSPTIILKTRRSLRAVHFHPHAAPFLLTAEVNDLNSSDSPLTLATSSGYLHYPPPAVFFANVNSNLLPHPEARVSLVPSPCLFCPTLSKDDGRTSPHNSGRGGGSANEQQREESLTQRLTNSDGGNQRDRIVIPMDISPEEPSGSNFIIEDAVPNSLQAGIEGQANTRSQQRIPAGSNERQDAFSSSQMSTFHCNGFAITVPIRQPRPGANDAPAISSSTTSASSDLQMLLRNAEAGHFHQFVPFGDPPCWELPFLQGAAELPCTVKLRIWPHDIQDPCAPLDPETCRLTISHAVLCSEMGAHFSPCGRYLVACVACLLPQMEGEPGIQSQMQLDATGAATSPTHHPLSSHQVIYELRIYSLEEATFGKVLASRAIRAAHCLTSIQFSPTSEHILLAYGRRHNSLLRSIVIDGETAIPIYTILEVYRVSDMELVRVLPSAEDEVNVACFHPLAGGGLVYGTKEGKLRILQYDGRQDTSCTGANILLEENLLEIQKYALEC